MKRLLQSVSLALAALLAVQPALATMTCAHMVCADGHSSPDCCLPSSDAPMNGMANDAAMPMSASGQAPSQMSEEQENCMSAPCCAVSSSTTTLLAASLKSLFSGIVPFPRQAGLVVTASAPHTTTTSVETSTSPPDRHALFQVFRI